MYNIDQKDPFAAPLSRASHVGDINTGRCYRKSHRALVKKKGVDIILQSILAMDKIHIDLGGRLQMEAMIISYGLLKQSVRPLPIAMRILGYINHSTPCQPPVTVDVADLDTEFNAPTGLPKGTVVLDAPMRHMNNLTWSMYLLVLYPLCAFKSQVCIKTTVRVHGTVDFLYRTMV